MKLNKIVKNYDMNKFGFIYLGVSGILGSIYYPNDLKKDWMYKDRTLKGKVISSGAGFVGGVSLGICVPMFIMASPIFITTHTLSRLNNNNSE